MGYGIKRGNYAARIIYCEGKKEWLIHHIKRGKRSYHTHIPWDPKNKKAIVMIMIRANQGIIPKHYPDWMVESINRLWFGKNYKSRPDLNNENLLTNDLSVRLKKVKKRGCKGYYNKPKYVRR